MDIYQIFVTHNRMWTVREFLFAAVLMVMLASAVRQKVKRGVIYQYQAVCILLAAAFLAVVFGSTVFTRNPGSRQYQLEVFWSWKEILGIGQGGRVGAGGSRAELLQENLLNMILLLPFGLLLPFIRGKNTAWYEGFAAGVAASAVIEVLQLILCRGLFEFDDIIHNGMGCMAGAVIGSLVLRMVKSMAQNFSRV